MSGSPWYAFGTKIREQGERRTLPDRRMYKPRRDWARSITAADFGDNAWNALIERRRRVAGELVGRRVGQRRRGARRDSELLVRGLV